MSKQTEALKLALNKAFQLGQRYWSWEDSEYSSHWKKADAAKSEFDQLVQDTINAALAEQPAQQQELEHDEHGHECSPEEFLLRGILASELKCWHRLTADEAQNLVAFVQNTPSVAATDLHPRQRKSALGHLASGCQVCCPISKQAVGGADGGGD